VAEVVRTGERPGKSFASVLASVPEAQQTGARDVVIVSLTQDSRQIAPGYAFVCLRGARDGHDFIPQAISRGAVALVIAADRRGAVPADFAGAVGLVPDTRAALALLARACYDDPCSRLTTVGVTGTNGKTTTALMVDAIFRAAGYRTGVLGTVEYRIGDRRLRSEHTTPEADELQRLLADMVEAEVTHVAMEVSSHAIALQRVDGCTFGGAIFTNLTPEHLDFHGDMADYLRTKLRLFQDPQYFPATGTRVNAINADDEAGREIAGQAKGTVLTYAVDHPADVRAEQVVLGTQRTRFTAVLPAGRVEIDMQPLGLFNVSNALAALTVCTGLGVPLETAKAGLESIPPVRGRFERVPSTFRDVLIDYAHTPDGLEKALESARELTQGRVLVVFGCGGNRDRTKRPVMGGLASRLADRCFVTSDNPRFEEPEAIIAEILTGIPAEARSKCVVEADRGAAIRLAIAEAGEGDLVLIAGKGHEDYQLVKGQTFHFDDREVAAQVLAELGGAGA
jgi:UDP-N-acetylmuramoyl-L-alanyl-D-glutamate--2,6-diaminopimelate ligase